MSTYFARLATSHGAGKAGGTAMPAPEPRTFDAAPTRGEPMEIETLVQTSATTSAPELATHAATPTHVLRPSAESDAHLAPAPAAPASRVATADTQNATRAPERVSADRQAVPRTGTRDTAAVRITRIDGVEAATGAAAALGVVPITDAPTRTTPVATAARAEPTRSPTTVIRTTAAVVEAPPTRLSGRPAAAPMTSSPAFPAREQPPLITPAVATPGSAGAEPRPITRDSSPANTPKVEVHIGRIELAVSAPRAPREAFNAHRHYLRVR